jgi:hypothetical protein
MSELPPILERLGAEVERVARAEAGARRPRRRRVGPSSRRVLILALVTVIAVAAAAVAATTGLLTGEPVTDPKGVGFGNPKAGLGVVLPKTARLAPLRVADPAGGLPWGVRAVTTTRGLGCVQVGRVQDGELGVVGQDGAFANDGKFHVMAPTVLSDAQCLAVDGAGHRFVAVSYNGLPASALPRACVAPRRTLSATPRATPPPTCPDADLRRVAYGLLGPEATAITYRSPDGAIHTQAVAGPDGAFLVVLPADADHTNYGFSVGRTPATAIASVRYRDGSVCRILSPIRQGGARPCPAKGYVEAGASLTSAAVASPVRVAVSDRPVALPGPQGAPSDHEWRLTVRFRARVATHGANGYYQVTTTPERAGACGFGGLFAPVARDVAAGTVVSARQWIPGKCRGDLHVKVVLHRQTARRADPLAYAGVPLKGDPVVGSATARIPRG